jgi:hypothetical protein
MKCLELVFQRVNKSLGFWILVLAPFYAAPAGAQSYSITNLGVLPGGTYSFSAGLNTKGEATGYGDASQGSVREITRARSPASRTSSTTRGLPRSFIVKGRCDLWAVSEGRTATDWVRSPMWWR